MQWMINEALEKLYKEIYIQCSKLLNKIVLQVAPIAFSQLGSLGDNPFEVKINHNVPIFKGMIYIEVFHGWFSTL